MKNSFLPLSYASDKFEAGPRTHYDIFRQFGAFALGVDTTNHLKFYDLSSLINDPLTLQGLCETLSAEIRVFCYKRDAKRGIRERYPNLPAENYAAGIVWIYEPRIHDGSFKDPQYTEVWRTVHEIGHCIVEPFMLARYGPSYRLGRLGRDMKVKWQKKLVEPASIRDTQRSVEWESLAFRAQRMLSDSLGVSISDSNYQKEYNVNLADAIFRALTGQFSNPGELGFTPDDNDLDLMSVLFALEDAGNQLSENDPAMTSDIRNRIFSQTPNLQNWYSIADEDIREAIEACSREGIAEVHKNWQKFDFYNIPAL